MDTFAGLVPAWCPLNKVATLFDDDEERCQSFFQGSN